MLIYLIRNNINGKCYVGQTTKTLEWRWREHRKCHRRFVLHAAIKKYGAENFTVIPLIQACSVDCLNYLEPLFIVAYNSLVPRGYNLDSGGKNNTAHPDTVARMSAAHKGRSKTLEHRARIGAAQKGREIPLEQRAKMSGTRRGREVTVEEYKQIYIAKHSRKLKRTHCRKGHLLPDVPNTFERGKSYRRCRACMLEYQRNYDRTVRPVRCRLT